MLFAPAAVNCHDLDLSARFNHKHMRWSTSFDQLCKLDIIVLASGTK